LEATQNHARIAAEVFEEVPGIRGNLVFDAHTAVLMREHGIRTIYTRDADFSRFPFIELVAPCRSIGVPGPADIVSGVGTAPRKSCIPLGYRSGA